MGAADADVVEAAVVAEGEFAVGVDAVGADAVVGVAVAGAGDGWVPAWWYASSARSPPVRCACARRGGRADRSSQVPRAGSMTWAVNWP